MNWEEIRLEEIADFRNGVNYTNDSLGSGIKVINVADFKDKMYPDYESLGELDSDAKWHKDCFLKENDIVFVRSNGNKNLIGRSLFVKNLPTNIKVTYSAFSIRLRFKSTEDICPEFYLYLFKSPIFRSILSQYGNGANISNLNQDILNNMIIPKPQLTIQQKISSILYTYDELIENNKQRIKILEEIAEEIYKEWFVRFRFPGYETTKIIDGLPDGWENGTISKYYTTSSGGTPSRNKDEYYINGKINWFKTKELLDTFIFSSEEKISEVALKKSSAKLFPKDTILIGMYGGVHGEGRKSTLGQLGILCEEASTNQASCAFLPKNNYYSYPYLFYYLKSKRVDFLNKSMGAAQQNISQDIIKNSIYLQPNENVIKSFDSLIKPFFEEIKVLIQKNQLLQETRDLLLPRLISGKLSVEHLLDEKEDLLMVAEPRAEYQNK
jgi:type I restriction enzyme S subunit